MAKLLTGVKSGFDLMPAGWYPISVTDVRWVPVKTGAHKGQPRLSLTYVVTDGPYENRKLFDGGMFTEDTVGVTRSKLEALDCDADWGSWDFPNSFDDMDAVDALREELIGTVGYALVGHQEYNGEQTERVRRTVGNDADPVLAYGDDDAA